MDESQMMTDAAAGGLGVGIILFYLLLLAFIGFCYYKIFQKAGRSDAWAGFVPIYNYVVLLEIIGKPIWWLAMLLIPCVNIYFGFKIIIELGARFGKSAVYSIVMFGLFGIIGIPLLAFGSDEYIPLDGNTTSNEDSITTSL